METCNDREERVRVKEGQRIACKKDTRCGVNVTQEDPLVNLYRQEATCPFPSPRLLSLAVADSILPVLADKCGSLDQRRHRRVGFF